LRRASITPNVCLRVILGRPLPMVALFTGDFTSIYCAKQQIQILFSCSGSFFFLLWMIGWAKYSYFKCFDKREVLAQNWEIFCIYILISMVDIMARSCVLKLWLRPPEKWWRIENSRSVMPNCVERIIASFSTACIKVFLQVKVCLRIVLQKWQTSTMFPCLDRAI
jgi:hypothetical protein